MARKVKKWRVALWSVAALVVAGVCVMLVCYQLVSGNARGRLYDNAADIPHRTYGLLLGTTPQSRYGGINKFFEARIDATLALVQAGKVDTVIISGSDHSLDGVNEVTALRDTLIARGVPSSLLLLDGQGYRTINSVVRCNTVFNARSVTIISQQFHNERALYQADHCSGVDYADEVIAFNARSPQTATSTVTYVREYLARVQLMLDLFKY